MKNTFTLFSVLIALLLAPNLYSQLRIAVLDSDDDIVEAFKIDPRMEAVLLENSSLLDSTYDAVIYATRQAIDTNIINYVENGYGGIVGEYDANDFIIQQGWITGTTASGASNLIDTVQVNYPNHYLNPTLNWETIPFGQNPVGHSRNISVTDPNAQIVATADHTVYGEIPFVVTKFNPFGNGAIVLLNCDYRDDPDYNYEVKEMITQCAYYAATAKPIKIAIVPTGGFANQTITALNGDFRLKGEAISSSELSEEYQAVIVHRGSWDENIANYLEAGYGGFVGELTANRYPIDSGYISGNPGTMYDNNITGLDSTSKPNHHIHLKNNLAGLPYGANPWAYSYNLSVDDMDAMVLATVTHDVFTEVPFIVTKKNSMGDQNGNFVLLNSDWGDDPDYNPITQQLIRECALYATINERKIAVMPNDAEYSDTLALIISKDPRLFAEAIPDSVLDESYDAVFVNRKVDSIVTEYIENGHGGIIGEWTAIDSIINKNWISGSMSGGTNTIVGFEDEKNNAHYLTKNVHFESLPYGTNPIEFMRNFTINDNYANLVATIENGSSQESPYIITKRNPFGKGQIILANSDLRDEPYNDLKTEKLIQELAYYATGAVTEEFCRVHITSTGPGTTDPEDELYIPYGETDTLFFIPNEFHHILSLTADGEAITKDSMLIFEEIHNSYDIDVEFILDTYSIVPIITAGGVVSPNETVFTLPNKKVTFTYFPAAFYHFVDVLVDGVSYPDSTSSFTFDSVQANHTIHVIFEIDKWPIYTSRGGGGTISPNDTVWVGHGMNQTFTITPNPAYNIGTLLIDDVVTSLSGNSYIFINVTDTHSIHVNFNRYAWVINANAEAGGNISPNGQVVVNEGANQTFVINANSGYELDNLFVDGTSVELTDLYTFTNVSSNHTISAHFIPSTGIESYTSKLNVYPNPARNELIIEGVNVSSKVTYNLISIDGSSKLSGSISNETSVLDITNLVQGYYILKLQSNEGTKTIRVIKE